MSDVMLRKAVPVDFIEPCLPSPAEKPPAGPGWVHEIKHDGFRLMARRDPAGTRLITRKGNDFTTRSGHRRGRRRPAGAVMPD